VSSTKDWSYENVVAKFGETGCSIAGCSFSHPSGCASANVLCCALNLSDAIVQAGFTLPVAADVNYCDHSGNSGKRVRNADGLARVVRVQNGSLIDASTWKKRPNWKGIVFFEGGLALRSIYEEIAQTDDAPRDFTSVFRATGHIDLWDGTKGVHAQYPDADTIWFWKLG
jgi:hypothetical protein